jgi:hypothetical protein
MSYLYKLTDEFGNTKNQTHWAEGTRHEIAKELRDSTQPLCSKHYYHAYENPLVAVFMNPSHANFRNPILWRATGWVSKRNGQLKCGCFTLRTLQQIPLPVLTTNQRVRVAIQCALKEPQTESFKSWAKNWLSGVDRTFKTVTATQAAAIYAAHAAVYAAAYATQAAAVYAAAVDAAAANAVDAAAAYAVVYAAPLNLIAIIKRAIREEPVNA